MRIRLTRRWLPRREREERGCAIVLMYHSISCRRPDQFNICVDPDRFAEHLELLRNRFRVVSLRELHTALDRNQPLTRVIALTFDDGYRDNLLIAKPLLERHGLPATVFVATSFVDSGRDFWWEELAAVCASSGDPLWPLWDELRSLPSQRRIERLDALWASIGVQRPEPSRTLRGGELERLADSELITIGAHTVTHPHLSMLPGAQQRQEIEDSSAFLMEVVGRPIRDFCYPHGDFSSETATLVESAGFETACTTHSAAVTRGTNPLELPRVAVMNWKADMLEHELERRLD